MATYKDHMETLNKILRWCSDGKNIALTPKELDSLQAGIEALNTLQDMGTYMQLILNNRYKGEDNKPW